MYGKNKKRHTKIFSSLNLQGKLHVSVVKLAHVGIIYGMRLLLNHALARIINIFRFAFRIGGNKF